MSKKISTGTPLSEEHKRFVELLKEIEKGQIETLNETGKRLIELSSATLGILLTIIALGKDFPPPYLQVSSFNKITAIAILVFMLLSLLAGFLVLFPRKLRFYTHNLSENKKGLEHIIGKKSWFSIVGGFLFILGMLSLALLIASIILDP